MNKEKCFNENNVFPKGDQNQNDHFTGRTWLKMLVNEYTAHNCPIGNVTFEPGAKNNWHRHPGGQILLITAGAGYYQEEGKPAQLLQPGDVVQIPSGVKHWHGATHDDWFSHLAITTNAQLGGAEWLEPVNDEEYKKL